MNFFRPTWVEVSKDAFASNVRAIKSLVGPKVKLLAVLKADAYGHGASALAPIAIENGAHIIGVSSLEEAVSLRDAKIKAPLLILGGIYPLENFEVALRNNVIPTVASLEAARALEVYEKKMGANVPLHLKVDTGMGRIGVSVEEAKKVLDWLFDHPNLTLGGIYSHFACADSDSAYTRKQLRLFEELKDHARRRGFTDTIFHMANSSALLNYRESHHDMVRPGLSLYGLSKAKGPKAPAFSSVLSWQTRVVFLKKLLKGNSVSYGRTFRAKKTSLIATVPAGYADGVPRSVSNKGFVLVQGKRVPIVGRVTMDHFMIDVTGLTVNVGDPVTLIGTQQKETITVHEWAEWADTISYEIVCGISKRVPRITV